MWAIRMAGWEGGWAGHFMRGPVRDDMDSKNANWENWLDHAVLSDIGLRRSNNQDSYSVILASSEESWNERGHLFLVADGMGAHAAGELASKMAADSVPHTYYKLREEPSPWAIKHAIEDANREIHSRGQANFDFRGMGTTASVLILLPEGALVGHVGDSRVYRLRGENIEQLTFDHSLVWEMMANGRIRESDVPSYIPRNVITRSLGPNESVHPDLEGPFPLAPGDTFLLCSDGLSGQLEDEELGVILRALPPDEATRALVDLANLRGGPDNITVIVARVRAVPWAQKNATPLESTALPKQKRTIHPFAWAAFGALTLSGIALFLLDRRIEAVIAVVAAAIVILVMGIIKLSAKDTVETNGQPAVNRRGPYKSKKCVAGKDFLDKLAQLAKQLDEAADEKHFAVDREKFKAGVEAAENCIRGSDPTRATREYLHAISFMMQELRRQ